MPGRSEESRSTGDLWPSLTDRGVSRVEVFVSIVVMMSKDGLEFSRLAQCSCALRKTVQDSLAEQPYISLVFAQEEHK